VTQVRNWAQSRVKIWVSIWVKTRVRGPGKTKHARQEDLFALGKKPFCTWEHQVYTRPIQQGDKVESVSNKKGQSELKEEI
jgi:hypothetical protein